MLNSAADTPEFDRWLDDFYCSYYRHRPVNATFIGVHDYDASLPDHQQLLRVNNDSVIKLNHVVHHGGIGHHVQKIS